MLAILDYLKFQRSNRRNELMEVALKASKDHLLLRSASASREVSTMCLVHKEFFEDQENSYSFESDHDIEFSLPLYEMR